ncbi:Metallo-dependent phosphatase [Polychaeton citri CBS 116435]|uniref:Metallo-dependent phosphatase n=1 Tax=Polychaeton citri CBS 116435 TaxID=1314669 RepID=A0A9P4QDK8_9PEZI|nr:Metallo-dependent phosphatase [Polychaeton citri CBS 116435]
MNLYAIADLHLSYKSNREDWAKLQARPDDGLIIAGDIGESVQVMREAFHIAKARFKMVWWVPGNHELYTSTHSKEDEMHLRGESKYMACVIAARECGVLTPEDDFTTVMYTSPEGIQEAALVCPIFTLYDYSFRPAHVSRENALAWAEEEGIKATDEALLHPDPYDSRDEWCDKLVQQAELKLQAACETGLPLVIINHWPLREDTVYIPKVPRFSLWCGTQKTHNWHTRFNAKVVVTGHLHVRRTDWIDGVRFEEVSLGYPRQWQEAKDAGNDVNTMLREILPGPATPEIGQEPPTNFRRLGWGWT